jgi:hypothetical protein
MFNASSLTLQAGPPQFIRNEQGGYTLTGGKSKPPHGQFGRHRASSEPKGKASLLTVGVIESTATTDAVTNLVAPAAQLNKKNYLNAQITIETTKIASLEKELESLTVGTDDHFKLEQKIQETRSIITTLEYSVSLLDSSAEQSAGSVTTTATPTDTTTTEKEKSIYSSVRFFTEFKEQTLPMQVIQVIFSVAILAVRLLIDGLVYVTNTFVDGVLEGKIRNGTVSKLAVKTVVDTVGDPGVIDVLETTGERLIVTYGNKASVVIEAMISNKATHRALSKGLVDLIKNRDLEQGLADVISSKKIKASIMEFIEDQAETVVGVAKRVLTDEELKSELSSFASGALGNTLSGGVTKIADNATMGMVSGTYRVCKAFVKQFMGTTAAQAEDSDSTGGEE